MALSFLINEVLKILFVQVDVRNRLATKLIILKVHNVKAKLWHLASIIYILYTILEIIVNSSSTTNNQIVMVTTSQDSQ